MATSRKTQAKAGAPEKRRGQQMGDERSSQPSQIDEAQRRDTSGKSPRAITPSVPAAIPTGGQIGESGGEAEFKARQRSAAKSARKGRK